MGCGREERGVCAGEVVGETPGSGRGAKGVGVSRTRRRKKS